MSVFGPQVLFPVLRGRLGLFLLVLMQRSLRTLSTSLDTAIAAKHRCIIIEYYLMINV